MSTITLHPESLKTWQDQKLEHLRYAYDLKETDLVIDIGAYRGEWAETIYTNYGCKVIAIEPTEYIRDFRHGQVINKAAATHNGKIQFGGMSYYTSAFEEGTHEYECFDINGMLKELDEIAVMKINIEGAEYDLLDYIISAGLHKKIRNFQVQFHQIVNRPYLMWYEGIAMKLSKTHKCTWSYPFCWENWELMA
jgi:FkbM family methyltransferase